MPREMEDVFMVASKVRNDEASLEEFAVEIISA
jgi:hypothetical protein